MTNKIVIIKSGLLGDTLVALPALHCLRNEFPSAKIVYVWQKIPAKNYVTPVEILTGSGLVDEFYGYEINCSGCQAFFNYLKLWLYCLRERFNIGIVLEPPHWPSKRKAFLRLCGIKTVLGPDGTNNKVFRDACGRLPIQDKISDSLVSLLSPLGISLPASDKGHFDVVLSDDELRSARQWLINKEMSSDEVLRLIAVAPGSNMPAKKWHSDNYFQVVESLIQKQNVIPIVFGGTEDKSIAQNLISRWKRGVNAAGILGVRDGIALLKHCKLYLGNDTGTMHMAVAAGIRCVAVFASIDMPGRWEPYGVGHYVFRADSKCAGCLSRECDRGSEQCINTIPSEAVYNKCVEFLEEIAF
ncbi:MAG: glycosyltransferase family 9 protein [Desulfuromonadaceae bacterium]|nr:glycosyltransferase family 9 protein [Desulfuromonadaceae bacterium]